MVIRLAFYLPWLEIFCGAALISLRFYLGGLLLITGLLVIFIAISIAARARGLDISCGCFGHALDNMKFSWHLALDFILLAIATALSWRARLVRY
jgi:putative oxidoreductase